MPEPYGVFVRVPGMPRSLPKFHPYLEDSYEIGRAGGDPCRQAEDRGMSVIGEVPCRWTIWIYPKAWEPVSKTLRDELRGIGVDIDDSVGKHSTYIGKYRIGTDVPLEKFPELNALESVENVDRARLGHFPGTSSSHEASLQLNLSLGNAKSIYSCLGPGVVPASLLPGGWASGPATVADKPTLVAPGRFKGFLTAAEGTSFAAPWVSGAAALLLEAQRLQRLENGLPPLAAADEADILRLRLRLLAQPLSPQALKPNPESGWGRLHVTAPVAVVSTGRFRLTTG